jgi:hypothetical protein
MCSANSECVRECSNLTLIPVITLLQEARTETLQLAAQLAELCKSIVRAAGSMPVGAEVPSTAAAMEAVSRLVTRAEATERELADLKLKVCRERCLFPGIAFVF